MVHYGPLLVFESTSGREMCLCLRLVLSNAGGLQGLPVKLFLLMSVGFLNRTNQCRHLKHVR